MHRRMLVVVGYRSALMLSFQIKLLKYIQTASRGYQSLKHFLYKKKHRTHSWHRVFTCFYMFLHVLTKI